MCLFLQRGYSPFLIMSILDLTHSGLLETYSRNTRSIMINHQILCRLGIVKQTSPRISLDLLAASSKTKLDRRRDKNLLGSR